VQSSDPRYKWRLVAFLFFVAALNYADRTATSAVFPLLRRDLGMSDLQLAAVGSFFLWSYAIGSPIAGYLADRLSRSRLVAWSLGLWSLITLATGMAPNAEILIASRALLGLAECLYLPAAIALIADHHPSESRATALGFHIAG
jgi:MFS family permease